MILKGIKLENIRSYLDQDISFPEGSLLLSGDIGSGKSTILLAVEFVLFGLQRGSLNGDSLLRNGKKKGSVELKFMIDDKEVIIKRTLKRSGDSVVQDSGIISINGDSKEKSAVELKELILNLLNYPKEMLTKKSLVYRYSVYTPQEEMKSILLGNKDLRLDTLRKVFDIDKYKRIKENSKIFLSKLKEDIKEFSGKIYDLDDKKKNLDVKNKDFNKLKEDIDKLLPKLSNISLKIENKKNDVKSMEDNIKILNELKKDLEVNEFKLKSKNEKVLDNNKNVEKLKSMIDGLEKEIKENGSLNIESINEGINECKGGVNSIESTVRELNNKIQEFRVKKNNSEDILKSIKALDICPTCKQKVSDEYKGRVIRVEGENIKNFENSLNEYVKNNREAEERLNNLKNNLESLRIKEKNYDLFKMKSSEFNEKKELLDKIMKECEYLKKEIGDISENRVDLLKKIKEFKEKDYEKVKKELDLLLEEDKLLMIKKSSLDTEIKNLGINIESLSKEVREKEDIKSKIDEHKKILNFIDIDFLKMMEVIEKKVMLKVYNDFNSLFEKWSDLLINNEILKVKLDNEFSPKIEQNGYDIDYSYLSGGEKTAIALAYRLSLNQVINNLMSNIKTRDLLILDEPTDGFSDEQLDRMKLVLDELNIKQVVIVSHESKIESFVDNVLRIEKKEHESVIC
ncbi:MAG: AAA family ATPase [Nanoarchaeota archaeon]|nr:AAA family ATPase [Nanoarchaeota archaeon]